MPITKTEATQGGGNAPMGCYITSNGPILTANVVGGTGPFTYAWSQAQNNNNIYQSGLAVQTADTPLANQTNISIAGNDAFGSAVLWQCIVTDSTGVVIAVGYYINFVHFI